MFINAMRNCFVKKILLGLILCIVFFSATVTHVVIAEEKQTIKAIYDKAGLKQIMDYAVEGGILKSPINIDIFADESFSTKITFQKTEEESLDYLGSADSMTKSTRERLKAHIQMLERHTAHPTIVSAVREQNARDTTLDDIKTIDKKWRNGMQNKLAAKLQNNSAGTYLRNGVVLKNHVFTEAFLCDKRGAVAGEYPETSDYW